MIRWIVLACILIGIAALAIAGGRGGVSRQEPLEILPDMDRQGKLGPQAASGFFADGMAMRPPPAGTIAMGYEAPASPGADPSAAPPLLDFGTSGPDDYLRSGRMGEVWGDGMPKELAGEVDAAFLKRGAALYGIHCAVCHGASGDGRGPLRAFRPNLPIRDLTDPATSIPDGSMVDAIAKGRGLMPAHGGALGVRERWQVVAYIRMLQDAAR